MQELEIKLRDLKLQKALLLDEIVELAEFDNNKYICLAKFEIEIFKTARELNKLVKNMLD